jgi:hypothetical protein
MELGKYVVPNFRLASLLDGLKKIDNTFKGEEGTKQEIAQILNQPADSGTLGQKISDLKAYGVLQGGRKEKYAVTDLGKRAISTDEMESQKAIRQAIGNIELWTILRRKHGTSIGKEYFPVILTRETGAEQAVAQKKAAFVRNAYIKDMRLIESVGEPTKGPSDSDENAVIRASGEEVAGRTKTMIVQPSGEQIAPNTVELGRDYGKASLDIRDQRGYDNAQTMLDMIRNQLGLKKSGTQLLLEEIAAKLGVGVPTTSGPTNDQKADEKEKENSKRA